MLCEQHQCSSPIFSLSSCNTLFNRASNLERHLTTCSERVKNIYPRNAYQILETSYYKLDYFGMKNTSHHKLFKSLAMFDFESICFRQETFKDEKTTMWIGKHVPISVSFSSNFVEEPIFLHNSDAHHLVATLMKTLEGLASQTKQKGNFYSLISRQQLKLEWTASWKNSPNVIIDGSMRELLTRVKMIAIKTFVHLIISCRYKRIHYLIARNLGYVIVMFQLCLVSTVRKTISI